MNKTRTLPQHMIGVELMKCLSGVLPSISQDHTSSTRVQLRELGDVIHLQDCGSKSGLGRT